MKAFTFRGREVYLASSIKNLLEISSSILSNYSSISSRGNNHLIKEEDFIIISKFEERQEFLRENPEFDCFKEFNINRLPNKFALYFESALDKLISFRENTRSYGRKRFRKKKLVASESKIEETSINQSKIEDNLFVEKKESNSNELRTFQKEDKLEINSTNLNLNLVINLLLKLDLENRQLNERVQFLENQVKEMSNLKELVHEYLIFKHVV